MKLRVARPETTIRKIREVAEKQGQTMFPIVSEDERFYGYILARELLPSDDDKTALQVLETIDPNRERKAIFVHDDDSLRTALSVATTNSLPFVPVLDTNQRYIGTIDATALLK